MKRSWKLSRPLYPTPVCLVTSISPEGKPNIITLAEVYMPCIRDPLTMGLSINPTRYSNYLIRTMKEFVVNIPTADMVKVVDYCGVVSGRNVDKFKAAGLTPEPATYVKPPLIGECPVNIECRLKQVTPIGYHDFFMGEGLAVHVDESILEDNKIDMTKAKPLLYNLGEYWTCGNYLGTHGFSRQ
jgi:flavin reductase (DIM6/NTAB) family NADH-FMN oxidoreductase RutF